VFVLWLAVHLRNEAGGLCDAALVQSVVHTALAMTPHVCLHDDGTVLLEVQSTLRLWGGWSQLLQRLQQAVEALRLGPFTVASAPTPTAAALFARTATPHSGTAWKDRLDALPLASLRHGQEHAQALRGMGLHTVGDLRALPRAGVARRWGQALLLEVDRARGDAPDPHEWMQPAPVFDEQLELPAKAETTDLILHGAELLLTRLLAWVGAHHARVLRFTLHLQQEQRSAMSPEQTLSGHGVLAVALVEPSSDRDHLLFMLRERLAQVPVIAPTSALRLCCEAFVRTSPPNAELFPTRASEQEGLSRMLERLQARLGPQGVRMMQPHADHRPERATRSTPMRWQASPVRRDHAPDASPHPIAGDGTHLIRPVWLLPTPQALKERQGRPCLDGHALQLLAGPERVESGWWDDLPALRDYFIAQAHDGSLVWVYRTRLPLTPKGSGWFLHGRFA
jgi:protein ImuB